MGRLALTFAIVLGAAFLAACSREEKADPDEGVLMRIDDATLMLDDVVGRIPVGMEPADSAALFASIVSDWIETEVISSLAETKLPDLEEIENKVRVYRNRLIVDEYLRRMSESREAKVREDSIKAFYDAHKEEMLTESPLVKGVYLKVPSSSTALEEIRRLMASGSESDIDNLEKNWIGDAIQYDYFGSTWIDWQVVAEQIPYRFYDPDAFLRDTRYFETSYNDFTYIFHISDYLPSGSVQPYEFASRGIAGMLERVRISDYQKALVESLVKKALKEKRLEVVGYDPIGKRLIDARKEKEKKDNR